jgi:glyoxylase-like metal-dependent hydrolase (beta-lactamase superfamily II)
MNANAFIPTTDNQIITLPLEQDQIKGCKLTVFQFMHTPGHTPGSQCFIVNGNRLFSGDVLFIRSHGRTDFPDSSQDLMNQSLGKLKKLEGEVIVYCGHDYG